MNENISRLLNENEDAERSLKESAAMCLVEMYGECVKVGYDSENYARAVALACNALLGG